MRNTKFVVLSLKDIMKNVMFLAMAIALIIAMLIMFTPEKRINEETSYNAGTYQTEITLSEDSSLYLSVVLTEDKIQDIYISDLTEEQNVFYPLIVPTFETVKNHVLKTQTTYLAVNPDILETSSLLLTAIEDAIYQGMK